MDLNIGTALWCAAAAAGIVRYPKCTAWRQHFQRGAGCSNPGGFPDQAAADCQAANSAGSQQQPRSMADRQQDGAHAAAVGGGLRQIDTLASPPAGGSAANGFVTAEAAAAAAAASPTLAEDAELSRGAWEGRPDRAATPYTANPYRSCARVALLGHGADEQCGGYGRHRTTFRRAVRVSHQHCIRRPRKVLKFVAIFHCTTLNHAVCAISSMRCRLLVLSLERQASGPRNMLAPCPAKLKSQ